MTEPIFAGGLLLAGLVLVALLSRWLSPRWRPGMLGGITGGFGVAAVQVAGRGDAPLLVLMLVLAVYGAVLGTVGWYFGRQ